MTEVPVVTSSDLVAAARQAEAFVASTSPRGHSLYHGAAGLVLFYLELASATGEALYQQRAVELGDEIVAHLEPHLGSDGQLSIAIYSGLPGYGFVLNELAKATGEARFRTSAVAVFGQVADQAQELGAGIGWIEPMPFSDITGMTGDRELLDLSIGAAGAGLGFLYAHRSGLHPTALELAVKTADRLLEMSVETEHGTNWLMMADMPFPFTAANFAHGAAGVGYFMADLYRATEDQRYLDAALASADYVMNKTVPSGDGVLVCHTDENPGLIYLGVCHGPPGTDRLMILLDEITEDPRWMEWAHANMAGLIATGAPEVRHDGLWQNYGQCCGDAGIGDYAINMFRLTGRPEYRELAQRIGAVVIERSELGPGSTRYWTQAEHRTRPDFVETQTGYMQGAAGIGSFLLHLAQIDEPAPAKIALPDSPV